MLAACDHHCCRSCHGDGDASADPWMALLQLFCNVATKGGRACYQRHSACLLSRHPWRMPRSSKRTRPGPSPPPPRPPTGPQARPAQLQPWGGGAPVLQGMAGAAVLLVVVGEATRGWWPCYFVVAAAATVGVGATAYATVGGGGSYKRRQRDRGCYNIASASATKGGYVCYNRRRSDGGSYNRWRRVGVCYIRRRRLLQAAAASATSVAGSCCKVATNRGASVL